MLQLYTKLTDPAFFIILVLEINLKALTFGSQNLS